MQQIRKPARRPEVVTAEALILQAAFSAELKPVRTKKVMSKAEVPGNWALHRRVKRVAYPVLGCVV